MNTDITTLNLAKSFLNVCNAALNKYNEKPTHILTEKILMQKINDSHITITVVDSGEIIGFFNTRFLNGQFTPLMKGKTHSDKTFTLPREFMQDVVEHPNEYVAHPEKLNLTWIRAEQ